MAQEPTPHSSAARPHDEADPSMDDILASIRRILSDEEKATKIPPPGDDVLKLDPSMMVEEGRAPVPTPAPARAEPEQPLAAPVGDTPAIAAPASASDKPPQQAEPATTAGLVAPEAAAQAASSVGTLMRTLISERNAAVHRGGPTLEDLVRDEIRPLLKGWLDQHLPNLVERLVRAEIERVVGRITS